MQIYYLFKPKATSISDRIRKPKVSKSFEIHYFCVTRNSLNNSLTCINCSHLISCMILKHNLPREGSRRCMRFERKGTTGDDPKLQHCPRRSKASKRQIEWVWYPNDDDERA